MTTTETLALLDADERVHIATTASWLDAEPTGDEQ